MIQLSNMNIQYQNKIVFKDSDISIQDGSLTAITGPSGAGKTTLFYMLGLISHNNQFQYCYNGVNIDLKNEKLKAQYRKSKIGFVFQDKNLHEYLSIEQNLQLYAYMSGKEYTHDLGMNVLKKVRLDLDPQTKVEVLSGGEKQRLAIGCALIKEPELIIADEPTSALDDKNTENIMDIFKEIAQDGKMVIIATHNKKLLDYCDRVYEIKNQKIQLMKEKQINNESLGNSPLQNMNKKFYRWYTYFDFGKSHLQKILLLLISSFILSLCIFSFDAKDTVINQYMEAFNKYNNNEVYVSCFTDSITQKDIQKLSHLSGVKNCYLADSFYEQQIKINGHKKDIEGYFIVPYYDYQKEQFQIEQQYQGDVYLNDVFNNKMELNQNDTLTLLESSVTKENLHIGGILKSDNSLIQYRDKSYPCVYVPYQYFNYHETTSVVLELKNFKAFYQISDKIKDINRQYQIVLSQSDYLSQMDALNTMTQQIQYFVVALFILTIIVFCICQAFSVFNQKYEIAVLKANGLSYIEIMKMMSCFLIHQIIQSFVTISIFIGIEYVVCLFFNLHVHIFQLQTIGLMAIMILVLHILPTLFATTYIANINTEKLLRF